MFSYSLLSITIGLIVIITSSCSHSATSSEAGLTTQMIEADTLILSLDDSTTQLASYIQPFLNDNHLQLAYLNKSGNNICFFDVASGHELKPIPLYKDGPNAIDITNITGLYHISPDTTAIYDYWSGTISYVDNQGYVSRRDTVSSSLSVQQCGYVPIATTSAPLTKYRGGWIMANQLTGEIENGQTIYSLSLYYTNGKLVRGFGDYPAIYGKPTPLRWNTYLYLIPSFTINSQEDIIVSFPASDSIRIYNSDLRYTSHYAGYSKTIHPKPSDNALIDKEHLLKNYCYVNILYDPWRELYYRIVALPIADDNTQPSPGQALPRPLAIVLLDKYFNKIGEYNIDDYCGSYSQAFVSKKGLHIHSYSDDDDILTFRTFIPKGI